MTTTLAEVDRPAPRGRPRDRKTHDAILASSRELLRSEGYAGFSIERVAALAGVSKTSIYRRWPSKGALLVELYMEGLPEVIVENPRSLQNELARYIQSTVKRLEDPVWRSILRSLVAEGQYDPETADLLRERVVEPRRLSGLALLRHAEETRQIRPGLDHEFILDALFGPIWYRLLFEHAPLDVDFAERLLEQLKPVLFAAGRAAKRGRKR